ncbi:hypothetical protein [Prosthecobacter sp.]|uniref:hypothetical protein n=1 Tax=Prosthecobacter sp. TaxID=1965333 RepID=UPI0037832945
MPARKLSIKRVIFALLVVLPILAVLYSFCKDAIINDLRLWELTKQLDSLPQPPNTMRISTNSAVGLLQGNGNHCDFFAGAVYRSQSSADAILQHYKGRQFQNPMSGENEDWDITILKDKNSFASIWLPYDFDHSEVWGLTAESYSAATLYLVCAMRSYHANDDFRCH